MHVGVRVVAVCGTESSARSGLLRAGSAVHCRYEGGGGGWGWLRLVVVEVKKVIGDR